MRSLSLFRLVRRALHEIKGHPKILIPGQWTPLRTRAMDYLTDRSTDPFYGPPYGSPQKIAEKENKQKYKQK